MTQVGMHHIILFFVVYYIALRSLEEEAPRVVLSRLSDQQI